MSESEQDATRLLLNKIEKGIPEIKYRSISTLNSKITSKILSVRELVEFYPEAPGILLNFINDNQVSAGKDVILKTIQIILHLSSNDGGARLLSDYGALEFLCQYKDNVKDNEKLSSAIELVLSNLVQARSFSKSISQSHSQSQSIPQLYSTETFTLKDLKPENKENLSTQFSKVTDFAQTKKANEKSFAAPDFDASFTLGRSEKALPSQLEKSFANQGVTLSAIKTAPQSAFHLESEELQKLKLSKEDFFNAVYVPMNEEDSKFLFDITVQLKYGEQRTIYNLVTENLPTVIEDFPIEAFLFQGELFGELFHLFKKSTEEIQIPLARVYVKILDKMIRTFNLYQNPHHKNKSQSKECDEFIISDDKLHVKNSYPTLNPPSAEIANDPTFKKHQKDNFQLTYFSVLDAIVSNATEWLQKSEFNDTFHQIWTLGTKILTRFKDQAPELIREAVKDYLRRFVKKFEEITEDEFYGNIEFCHLPTILYNLFRIYTFEEYQSMDRFKSSQIVQILVKGVYKFSFTENEVEDILTYLKYLTPDLHSKHNKTMGLLSSIIKLREREPELVRARIEDYVRNSADLEGFVESLEKLLVSIPHASFPNFVELYVDAFLFCQTNNGPDAKELYERSKALVLHLFSIPNNTIRTILIESFNNNLNSDAKYFSHQAQTKRVLTFQALLDDELLNELVFTGLDNEAAINSTAKLLLNFAVLARENKIDKERLQHILAFSTLFYGITNNPSSTHESLKSANNLLWRIDAGTLLRILLSDLFSKTQKKRIAAYRTLTTPRFIKRLKQEQEAHQDAIRGFEDVEKKLKDNRILVEDLEDVEKDPLRNYLDSDQKHFLYKGHADGHIFSLDLNIAETYEDLENLLKISNDTSIEPTLRMSSLEQLSEYIDSLLRALNGSSINRKAIDIARRIFQTCTGTFITYCYDNVFNPTYATKLLLVINKFIHCQKLPEELIATVIPLFDLNSKILEQHGTVMLNALILLAGERNELVRYQALCYINALVFYFEISEDRVSSEYKRQYALKTLNEYRDHFFVFSHFDSISFETPFKKIWKIYPLEDYAKYFIDMHINNFDKLKDPHFSVQDEVIRSRCAQFIQKIRSDGNFTNETSLLLSGALRWTKVISILDLYLPPPLLDYDVFLSLTKVFNSNLTFLGLRNNSNIYKVTFLIERLLKSTVIIREINSNNKLLTSVLEFVEFVSSTVLGPVYELQFESAREKLDIILSALKIITGLLKLSNKAKQTKIKHLLVKKVIKQNFLNLLSKLASFFSNNESLHLQIAKFCRQLFYIPEIYLVLELEPLISNIFDFMFQCAHLENFKNKGLERWFLKFFLDYSRLEDDPSKIPLKSLNMSLSKLSQVSKQHVVNASSIGWLLRIAEDRETYIRVLAWNLISNLANVDNINSYQSSIESGLQVLYSSNESFGVVLNAIHFLNKAIDLFMNVSPFEEILASPAITDRTDELLISEGRVNNSNKPLNREGITKLFYRRNILSYLKVLLQNENSPPVYVCNLAALLRNVCLLSPQKSLPILSQLEFWDLLIEVINPKKIKAKVLGKDLLASGRTLYESLILVNNIAQFFIYSMSYDRQIGDYLIFCTKMINVIFKWLRIITLTYEKPALVESPSNLFLVDSCAKTLVQLLNTSLFISPDKTIVMANKLYEEKIEKSTKTSKYNIYLLISNVFNATKHDSLLLSLFKLLGNLLPQWKKGLSLVESEDKNGETLSESLILNLYSHYKLNETVFSENKIGSDEYHEVKNAMIACTCALLSTSNPAKIAFICSGFLGICLKSISKSSEHLMLEDLNTTQTGTAKKKNQSEHDISMSIMMQSRFSHVPTNFHASQESIRSSLKILGYLFAEASVSNFRQNDLLVKLEEHIYNIFDNILKSWRLIVRKDELLEELLRSLTNFVSNNQVGTLCAQRLADPKNPILNDVVILVTKFESTDKVTLRIGFQFLHDIVHSKEIRCALFKTKLIDHCLGKLNKIWNNRKEWTMTNFFTTQILNLFLSLSFYKDSHTRIVVDSQLLEQCMDLAQKDEFRGKIAEKIWKLMSNLSYHKSVKSFFVKYEDIFAMALAALNLEGQSLKMKWIVTQFFVNIMYKCNSAVTLIKKEHIVDQFFYFKKEVERELDKMTFTNTELEENEETIDLLKKLLDTLTKINLFMK